MRPDPLASTSCLYMGAAASESWQCARRVAGGGASDAPAQQLGPKRDAWGGTSFSHRPPSRSCFQGRSAVQHNESRFVAQSECLNDGPDLIWRQARSVDAHSGDDRCAQDKHCHPCRGGEYQHPSHDDDVAKCLKLGPFAPFLPLNRPHAVALAAPDTETGPICCSLQGHP